MTTALKTVAQTNVELCDGVLFRDSTGSIYEFRRNPKTGEGYAYAAGLNVELADLRLPFYLFD
jgi:hypothetical protein